MGGSGARKSTGGNLFFRSRGSSWSGMTPSGRWTSSTTRVIKGLSNKFNGLALLCCAFSRFCRADRHFCKGGAEERKLGSGDRHSDGGDPGDHVGDRLVQGRGGGSTGAEPQQLDLSDPVCGGHGSFLAFLLQGATTRSCPAGDGDR